MQTGESQHPWECCEVSVETAGMCITLGARCGTQRQDLAPLRRGDQIAQEEEKIFAVGV